MAVFVKKIQTAAYLTATIVLKKGKAPGCRQAPEGLQKRNRKVLRLFAPSKEGALCSVGKSCAKV
jgi:hypothetical protein